jgi:hypothetical protein
MEDPFKHTVVVPGAAALYSGRVGFFSQSAIGAILTIKKPTPVDVFGSNWIIFPVTVPAILNAQQAAVMGVGIRFATHSSFRIKTVQVYHGETPVFEKSGLKLQGEAIHTESFTFPATALSDGIVIAIDIEWFPPWEADSRAQIVSASVELRRWGILGLENH